MRNIEICTIRSADGQFHSGEIVQQPGKHTGAAIGGVVGAALLGPAGGIFGALIGSGCADRRISIRANGCEYRGEVVSGSRRLIELE